MINLISAIKRLPSRSLLGLIGDVRRVHQFRRQVNAVRGVFSSFRDAANSAPEPSNVGYDSDAHATMYDGRIGKLFIYDYVLLYWLSRLLPEAKTVFDLGGHKGELYYGFSKRLDLSKLEWLVCDVPSTVAEGERYAESRGVSALKFTDDAAKGDGADLVIASGVLQYLEEDLASIIENWNVRPRFVLVNVTPMYDGDDYVTLQNTQLSYNPYRVFNRAKLVNSLERLGYELRDEWQTERSLTVPFHPEKDVENYQGFLLVRPAPHAH